MSNVSKDERIDIRLKNEHKEALLRAAALLGLSLSDFVVSTSIERANEILRSQTVITMSPRDLERFLAALDEDAEPTETLKNAADRYKQLVGECELVAETLEKVSEPVR
jgi:uncharacterized protein (DUF1778 family)